MKDNKLIKSGVSGVVDGENQTVGDDELELINRFTRRNLAKNEVYAFSVTTGSRQGHIFPFVRATGILFLRLTAELSRK